ncbi:MAG TPA: FKBP-type peptidyl-prolyl cis-trans isomerase [Actinomycetota bacterium]|nr:FKBP-type peptidyl-prolyl cis-trans isomerase [Actinomycetota bacterium]
MKTYRWFALLAALSLLVAACGDDSPSEGGGDAGGGDTGGCEVGETVTTDSGLEYEEIECGDGDEVARGDTITVHYTGTLENGDEFDSSRGGEPVSFALDPGMLIEGWVEGIPGMREGGRRELTIPPELGYGEAGNPPAIPGDATLIFDVEVIEIQDEP